MKVDDEIDLYTGDRSILYTNGTGVLQSRHSLHMNRSLTIFVLLHVGLCVHVQQVTFVCPKEERLERKNYQ